MEQTLKKNNTLRCAIKKTTKKNARTRSPLHLMNFSLLNKHAYTYTHKTTRCALWFVYWLCRTVISIGLLTKSVLSSPVSSPVCLCLSFTHAHTRMIRYWVRSLSIRWIVLSQHMHVPVPVSVCLCVYRSITNTYTWYSFWCSSARLNYWHNKMKNSYTFAQWIPNILNREL